MRRRLRRGVGRTRGRPHLKPHPHRRFAPHRRHTVRPRGFPFSIGAQRAGLWAKPPPHCMGRTVLIRGPDKHSCPPNPAPLPTPHPAPRPTLTRQKANGRHNEWPRTCLPPTQACHAPSSTLPYPACESPSPVCRAQPARARVCSKHTRIDMKNWDSLTTRRWRLGCRSPPHRRLRPARHRCCQPARHCRCCPARPPSTPPSLQGRGRP